MASNEPVPLFVEEQDGIARPTGLADGGIPLPDGLARSTPELTLTDSAGRSCPAQFWVMSRWPSGAIQWVHAQTPVRLAACQRLEFKLAARPSPAVEPGVWVRRGPREILLENRRLRVRVPTDRFRLPGEVFVDPSGTGRFDPQQPAVREGRFVAEDDQGAPFPWGENEPVRATVEEEGPLRAVVRLTRGRHSALGAGQFDLVVRLYLEADSPALRMELTYISTDPYGSVQDLRPASGVKAVGRLAYTLEAELSDGAAVFGGDGDAPLTAESPPAELLQDRADHYSLDAGREGQRAGGWVSVPGRHGLLLLAARDFWQQFPKALRREEAGRLTLDFWPARAGVLHFFPGWAKTHELMLGFPRDEAERAALLAHFRTPPRLCPTPAAYLASEAVDPFIEPDWQRWPTLECVLGDSYASQKAAEVYGEIDYGDRHTGADRFWNGYHAPEREWLIHYQRTGDERYFRLARPMARHRMDIDVLHWPPEDAGQCHSDNTTSHWTPGSYIRAWVEGLAEYALMTGDRRAREVLAECGTWLTRNLAYTNERTSAIPMLALSHCYRAVNEPAYLETAKQLVDHLHEVVMTDSHIRTPFMVGHLVDGMHWYWKLTGDPKAKEAAVRAARWMHTVCVGPTGMPYYTDREDYPKESRYWRNHVYTWAAGEVATPAARAYLLAGDQELLRYTGYILDSWLHYYWGGGGGAYHGCPLAVYAMNAAGLTEADVARTPPGMEPDEVAARVQAYIAQPPEEDNAVPGLIPELGRFLLDAGQAGRGLEVFAELVRSHADKVQGLAAVCDRVEARLAAAAGQTERAEAALQRFIGRYPEANPEDALSPGHFRVAAAYRELAQIWAAAGRQEQASAYQEQARRYTGTRFVWPP